MLFYYLLMVVYTTRESSLNDLKWLYWKGVLAADIFHIVDRERYLNERGE